jgi:hypothetical protein
MRILFLLPVVLLASACSDTNSETAAKTPAKPVEPVTGQQAFQATFPSARMWATDCQLLQIRSLLLDQIKATDGKAGAWEITYVSVQKGASRPYTWSAVEAEGNIHQGVFGGSEDPWSGNRGGQTPFAPAALKIDTPAALISATSKATAYLQKPGEKPPISYILDLTSRFPNPVWHVFWGATPASAEYTVMVDATTGSVLTVVK